MAGLEPAPQGLEGPQAAVTPHSPGFGPGVGTRRPNTDPVTFTGPSTSVGCQRHRSFELVGGKGFEPNRSLLGERGYSPSADHPLVPPCWRQRQGSNPDPRVLETRMLPLHHAADVTSQTVFENRASP